VAAEKRKERHRGDLAERKPRKGEEKRQLDFKKSLLKRK